MSELSDYKRMVVEPLIAAKDAEIKRLSNEASDLAALVDAYRKWVRQCPILEATPKP